MTGTWRAWRLSYHSPWIPRLFLYTRSCPPPWKGCTVLVRCPLLRRLIDDFPKGHELTWHRTYIDHKWAQKTMKRWPSVERAPPSCKGRQVLIPLASGGTEVQVGRKRTETRNAFDPWHLLLIIGYSFARFQKSANERISFSEAEESQTAQGTTVY